MKKFLFLLLLVPVISFGQSRETSKKTNKILIILKDTTNILKKISLMLYENGYSVETKDEQLKFISSTEKSLGDISIKVKALVKDSMVIFSGSKTYNSTGFGLYGINTQRVFNDIYFNDTKRTGQKKAWDELFSLAQKIGTNIKYSE